MSRATFRAHVLDADPFDISMKPTPAWLSWAKWFVEITKDIPGQYHIRRVYYRTLGKPRPDGRLFDNIDSDWQALERASLYARYLGLVPLDKIVDNKNEGAMVLTPYAPDKLNTELNITSRCLTTSKISRLDDIIYDNLQGTIYYDAQSRQPYHLEIWVEKSTLNDILIPIAKRYGATLVVAGGQFSLTNVKDCFYRIKELGKPVRLFYLRDFDPGGQSMPAAVSRKLEWLIRMFKPGLNVKLQDVALSHDQCIEFKLPRSPMAKGDAYKGNFENLYGEGATELDSLEALHPGKLADILTAAIEPYYDKELRSKINDFSNQERKRFEDYKSDKIRAVIEELEEDLLPLAEQFNDLVEEANEIGEEIENMVDDAEIEDDFEPRVPEKSNHVVDNTDNSQFLLDTCREYGEQLRVYELHRPPRKKREKRNKKIVVQS